MADGKLMNYYNLPLPARILRSARRSLAIEIRLDEILIRAPKDMQQQEIDAFVYEKRSWIEKHCKQALEQRERMSGVEAFSGEEIRQLARMACEVIPKKVAFYAEVEKVFPRYWECQKWLKENGALYLARMR